jgi:hypothetical protein
MACLLPCERLRTRFNYTHDFFPEKKDNLMNLIDSLAGNQSATSVVRLSLETTYLRSYSTISKAIDHVFNQYSRSPKELTRLLEENLPSCEILVTDITPVERPFAPTLEERCFIYKSSHIKKRMPVTIGHNYSFVCALPKEKSWALPLSIERVKPAEVRSLVGIKQVEQILENSSQKWIHVADTDYSNKNALKRLSLLPCTSLIRLRSNRVLYFPANWSYKPSRRPKIYGKKFYFKYPSKAHEQILIESEEGYLKIERWNGLLIRDIQVQIDVVRIRLYKNNRLVFKHPIWIAIVGQKEIATNQVYNAYKRRFDIEHFFRFGKRKLLLNSFQTPKVESEENWQWIAGLSQWMLYFAKQHAAYHPLPWEKKGRELLSPSDVQRDYARIIKEIAQQANFPKRRGNSSGRHLGTKLAKRKRYKIIRKSKFKPNKAQAPPKTGKN